MLKYLVLALFLLISIPAYGEECHDPNIVASNVFQADPEAEVSLYEGNKAAAILGKISAEGGTFDRTILVAIGRRAAAIVLFRDGCAAGNLLSGNPRGLAEEIKKVLGNDV